MIMKSNLVGLAKTIAVSLKRDPEGTADVEFAQAKLRVIIKCIVFLYLLFSFAVEGLSHPETATLFYLIGFIGIAIALCNFVRKKPGTYPLRRLFASFLDAFAITFFMHRGGETAAIMFPLYLWVTLGHGFRFGPKYLFFSLFANLIGFLFLCTNNSFWQRADTKWVFLLTLIIIPFYAISLIKKLRTAVEKAQEASEEKSRFVSNMSHEIRTPLHGIIGISELLSVRQYDEEYRALCDSLSKSASVLLRLVNGVLDFSKIESGKLEITTKPFDLYELMEDTVKVFRNEADKKSIVMQLAIETGMVRHWVGDARHIQQVLINLIGNSLKFTQNGAIVLKVEHAGNEDGAHVRFSVQDTGIGIPEEYQSKIFERFSQAPGSATSQYRGTGLGTTIAKQLVEAMDGRIGFISRQGTGSTFWFEVPLQHSDEVQSAAFQNLKLNAWAETDEVQYRRKLKILVAEDNEVNQLIIAKILKISGFKFDIASDGEEALEALKHRQYDVALLDMQMPNMSGIEVCKAYKIIRPQDRHIDFIMLSANVDQREREKAISVGFSECLAKPIESGKLLALLDRKAQPESDRLQANKNTRLELPADEKNGFRLIDRSILLELLSLYRDKEFLNNVIASYSEYVIKSTDAIEDSLHKQRFMDVQRHAHAMRGIASNLGVVSISSIAHEIETMNPLQVKENVPGLLVKIREFHPQAVEALSKAVRETA
jgi:two-component system sensor histidine kinase RpfC